MATYKKIKKINLIIPLTLTYTEKLTEKEYRSEIKAVFQKIKEGAREWAYSVELKEGKNKIVVLK